MFCPKCGADNKDDAALCTSCGINLKEQSTSPVKTAIRDPWIALILSFFFVGWGQWYNGRTREGLIFFGGFLILILFMYIAKFANIYFLSSMIIGILLLGIVLIYIYGMADAFKSAEKINSGNIEFAEKSKLFWLPIVVFIIVLSFRLCRTIHQRKFKQI